VLTGLRLLFEGDRPVQPERNLFVRGLRRLLPMSPEHAEARFLVRREGRLMATPLLPALLAVESTDLVFALDSIPAVSESVSQGAKEKPLGKSATSRGASICPPA
jgi:tellurite resistance protein TerC